MHNRLQEISAEIDGFDADYILNVSTASLSEYFEEKYQFHVPVLGGKEEITADIQDINRLEQSSRSGRSIQRKGTIAKFFVPFEGDPQLFFLKPGRFRFNVTKAQVKNAELVFEYFAAYSLHQTDEEQALRLKKLLEDDLDDVRFHLESMSQDAKQFNETLRSVVPQLIEARKKKLLHDRGIGVALGFPFKPRIGAPQTYVVPTIPKKIPSLPSASKEPYMPEPVLDMENYEHILSVIQNMVLVMERSPEAFGEMSEENLRQHFLVQLNGQYEGQATGETFNASGKTDILIRVDGRNIFIAECKFWDGPKSLTKAINQLLDYTSWRDTKTAILIFNRNQNLSAVLAKIPDIVKEHPNFRREHPTSSETAFRYTFTHRGDPGRELTLTVMVFEVPSET